MGKLHVKLGARKGALHGEQWEMQRPSAASEAEVWQGLSPARMLLPHQWLRSDANSPSSGFVGWSRKTRNLREQRGFGGVDGWKRMTVEEEERREEEVSAPELLLFWIQLTCRRLCLTLSWALTTEPVIQTSLYVHQWIYERRCREGWWKLISQCWGRSKAGIIKTWPQAEVVLTNNKVRKEIILIIKVNFMNKLSNTSDQKAASVLAQNLVIQPLLSFVTEHNVKVCGPDS